MELVFGAHVVVSLSFGAETAGRKKLPGGPAPPVERRPSPAGHEPERLWNHAVLAGWLDGASGTPRSLASPPFGRISLGESATAFSRECSIGTQKSNFNAAAAFARDEFPPERTSEHGLAEYRTQ
jgi:hypothetical protein